MKLKPIFLGVAVALTACGHDSSLQPIAIAPTSGPASAAAKRGPTAEEQTKGMVEAVSIGKSETPVSVKFVLSQRPVVGHALEVAIAILPQISAGPASVSITGSEGLNVGAPEVHVELPSVDETQVYRQTVTVTPTADGVQMVTVNVMLHHDDANDTRSFSVPVIVGSTASP